MKTHYDWNLWHKVVCERRRWQRPNGSACASSLLIFEDSGVQVRCAVLTGGSLPTFQGSKVQEAMYCLTRCQSTWRDISEHLSSHKRRCENLRSFSLNFRSTFRSSHPASHGASTVNCYFKELGWTVTWLPNSHLLPPAHSLNYQNARKELQVY
jgi:hypothetical protein